MILVRQLFAWATPALLAVTLGLASLFIQSENAKPHWIDGAVAEYAVADIHFQTLDPLDTSSNSFSSARYSVRATAIIVGDRSAAGNTLAIVSPGYDADKLEIGATYTCNAELAPTEKWSKFGFRANCQEAPKLLERPGLHTSVFQDSRSAFLDSISGISDLAKGLVAGLAIGETSTLSQEFESMMRKVGLTHLTAVSGANCAIVIGLVYLLVRRVVSNRWLTTVISLAALVCYVALVGPEPSVLRSAFMAAVVLIAVALGRPKSGSAALAFAIICLLCADPWLAIDYGFMLSVAATGGILLLTAPITTRLRGRLPGWLAVPLAVSMAAQIMCLPVLLQLQSGLATYSLIANLLVEPLVAPITVLGILACLVAWPLPFLATTLTWLASLFAHWIVLVTTVLANLPGTQIPWPSGFFGALASGVVVALLVTMFFASSEKARWFSSLGLLLSISLTLGGAASAIKDYVSWPNGNWYVTACNVGQGDAFVLRSANQVAVVDVGKESELIDECLTRLGVSHIDLLVLTHFDQDHVGGLSGAIAGRSVHTALVSPFPDERWAASKSLEQLHGISASVHFPWAGQTGTLGEFHWEVLNPSASGQAPDSSNDGSLAILFRHPRFNFLTLADLGERAQMRLGATSSSWLGRGLDSVPMILKVAHHGSADQFPELTEALRPDLCLVSVGANNSYGHPTKRALQTLEEVGCAIRRTDVSGSISVGLVGEQLSVSVSGVG